MTPEQLAVIAGSILSLGFAYIPGLSAWFDGLVSQKKALVMAGLIVGAALVIFACSCAGVLSQYVGTVTCTKEGAGDLVVVAIYALIANGGTYVTLVRPFKK